MLQNKVANKQPLYTFITKKKNTDITIRLDNKTNPAR